MKKKFILPAVVMTVVIAGSLHGLQSMKTQPSTSNLTLANIEALTEDEADYTMLCFNSLNYTGSWNHMVLDCKSCSFVCRYVGYNSSRCTNK